MENVNKILADFGLAARFVPDAIPKPDPVGTVEEILARAEASLADDRADAGEVEK